MGIQSFREVWNEEICLFTGADALSGGMRGGAGDGNSGGSGGGAGFGRGRMGEMKKGPEFNAEKKEEMLTLHKEKLKEKLEKGEITEEEYKQALEHQKDKKSSDLQKAKEQSKDLTDYVKWQYNADIEPHIIRRVGDKTLVEWDELPRETQSALKRLDFDDKVKLEQYSASEMSIEVKDKKIFENLEKYRQNISEQKQTASNSFIEDFKDTLYTCLAEGITKRLGELIALNEDKWITIKGNHILLKDGESPKEALERTIKKDVKLKEEKYTIHKNVLNTENQNRNLTHEVGTVFDDKGNIVKVITSNNNEEIDLTGQNLDYLNGNILTHNHPEGSPISAADIATAFVTASVAELRATTPNGNVYSLKPNKNFAKDMALKFAEEYNKIPLEAAKSFKNLCKNELAKGTLDKEFLKNNIDNLFKVFAWKEAEKFLENNADKYGFDYRKD
jgi:hypothetical protein